MPVFPRYAFLMAAALCGLSACGDVSEITAEDEARRIEQPAQTTASAPSQSLPVSRTHVSGVSQQGVINGCTPGRLCSQSPNRQAATASPDASGYFATGRAQAANRQAQGQLADQRILLNNGKPETYPGQRTTLQSNRTSLQQQELRQQRDRLQTAPFGHTVGSIYSQ